MSNDTLLELSEAGLKALNDDTQMDDEVRLFLEVVSRVGEIDGETADIICDELVELTGSAEAALELVKLGGINFRRESDEAP